MNSDSKSTSVIIERSKSCENCKNKTWSILSDEIKGNCIDNCSNHQFSLSDLESEHKKFMTFLEKISKKEIKNLFQLKNSSFDDIKLRLDNAIKNFNNMQMSLKTISLTENLSSLSYSEFISTYNREINIQVVDFWKWRMYPDKFDIIKIFESQKNKLTRVGTLIAWKEEILTSISK